MINIVICDDESSYLEIISSKIQRLFEEELDFEYHIECVPSLDELYGFHRENKIDIVFLDVVVNSKNSVDWLITHQPEFSNTQFIVMTAYPVEIYNLSEIDCCYFLIKSKMTDEQLCKALKRSINAITKFLPKAEAISFGKKSFAVDFHQIIYIESFNNSIVIHMADNKTLTVYSTLKSFAEKLTPNFLKCHKCYIINMNFVHGFEPHCFIMSDDSSIPVPAKKYSGIVETYKKYLQNL